MITYQDFEKVKDRGEEERMSFIQSVINSHKNSDQYKMVYIANQYNKHLNVTIGEYQKLLYTVTGKAVPDNYSANFKMACRHFHRFITQENQFLLGNGVTWGKEDTDEKLGTNRYAFDTQLQDDDSLFINHDGALRQVKKKDADFASSEYVRTYVDNAIKAITDGNEVNY